MIDVPPSPVYFSIMNMPLGCVAFAGVEVSVMDRRGSGEDWQQPYISPEHKTQSSYSLLDTP